MKSVKHDGMRQRQILIGMMTSKPVLATIAAHWEPTLFDSKWERLVAGWAVDHYRKYKKAPKKAVEGYYAQWASNGHKDDEVVEMVEGFLHSLSSEYERNGSAPAVDFLLDQANQHFNLVRLREHKERLEALLEDGKIDDARELARAYKGVEVGKGSAIKPLGDESVMVAAFAPDQFEPLIRLPGALGAFFNHMLGRDCFVAMEGKAKIGKSFNLVNMLYYAVKQGRKCAYFEAGDMSRNQLARRIASRFTKRPVYGDKKHPVKVPVGIESGKPPLVTYEERSFPDNLTAEEANAALARIGEEYGEDTLYLSCHPNRSLSMSRVAALIDQWTQDDGEPFDCIFVDYPDIMKPDRNLREPRDEINETWMALRALSEDTHSLVLVVTQTDADGYTARTVKLSNFSGDRRKNDHVTGMVGINQTEQEKKSGLYRLNWVAGRELEFDPSKEIWCASCLPLANPCVRSTF